MSKTGASLRLPGLAPYLRPANRQRQAGCWQRDVGKHRTADNPEKPRFLETGSDA